MLKGLLLRRRNIKKYCACCQKVTKWIAQRVGKDIEQQECEDCGLTYRIEGS